MKKILIAYDGSPGAENAAIDLVRAGLPERAEARVLTIADVCLPLPGAGREGAISRHPGVAKARERAAEALREATQSAVQGAQLVHHIFPSWQISRHAAAGSPAWEIMAEGARWGSDLIVIGSHGRTPAEAFFLGSVSAKVAAEAHCSVRLARPRGNRGSRSARILVGLDGSEDAKRAGEEAQRRRWGSRTHVDLVTILDAKLKTRSLAAAGAFDNPAAMDRIEDCIKEMHEEARAGFASRELEVECHTFEGDPKAALLRCAAGWGTDCIFLGARGLDHGGRRYLGTLASAVCARAHCTVEIVRGPRELNEAGEEMREGASEGNDWQRRESHDQPLPAGCQ